MQPSVPAARVGICAALLLLGLLSIALVRITGENREAAMEARQERAAIAALPGPRTADRTGFAYTTVAREAALRRIDATQPGRAVLAFRLALGCFTLTLLLLIASAALALTGEAERRRDREALRLAREASLAAERARARLLAAASHDLRQPLQAVQLFASALQRRATDPETLKLLEGLHAATAGMGRMFNTLLDMSRLDAGAVTVACVDFPLPDVFDGLRAEFEALAAAKGLRLSVVSCPVALRTDPVLLESMIRNLLSNAIKYTHSGEVSLRCRMEERRALIEVADTGPGIPEGEIDAIFQEFRRLPGSSEAAEGLGLGLAIVRRLAGLLGLDVRVESATGVGSRFIVEVPMPGEAVLLSATALPEAAPRSLAGLRVLLVDDDAMLRMSLASALEDAGLKVVAVASDREARALFEQPSPPGLDFVLTDRDLGTGTTGIDLLGQLAARHGLDVPALVITGATEAEVLQELRDSGYPWLSKPVTLPVLLAAIRRALAEAERQTLAPAGSDRGS